MILLTHILVALFSIIFTTYLYFAPSKAKLYTAYTLVGLTLTSGTYLVVIKPSHILQTCVTGLVYLAVVGVGVLLAQRKLAVEYKRSNLDDRQR
jgi:hypothetical protein